LSFEGYGREFSKYLTRSIQNNRPYLAGARGNIKAYESTDLDKDTFDLDLFRRIRCGGVLGFDVATCGARPGA
jgi:hypothetical protein